MNRREHSKAIGEAIALINDAYFRLDAACEHSDKWDKYTALCVQDERDYRKHRPTTAENPHMPPLGAFTVQVAARFWAVKEIFERLVPAGERATPFIPEAKDFFHIRAVLFAGAAIADICKAEILRAFSPDEMKAFLRSAHYDVLMRTRAPEKSPDPAPAVQTIGQQKEKDYRCKACGHVKKIKTNHWGECYSYGHYNVCPVCPPFKRPNTWECLEEPPAGFVRAASWTAAGFEFPGSKGAA